MEVMGNRLERETSPYLLQHKDNPVDWFPWGDEALELARSKDRPILLSVGYSACHWCHVMAHESFEDEATAESMNAHFVCVKVDREERPDIDSIYMDAVQAMTGHGGWPMTVFLTPDGIPFYGGTYFPPEDRAGMPSFKRLLAAVAETWRTKRSEIEDQGTKLVEHIDISTRLGPSDEPVTSALLETAATHLTENFDPEYGGFGGAPKFPQPMIVDLAMRLDERSARGQEQLRDDVPSAIDRTLEAMAAGGMYDQIGGGFARYSVDRFWLVPHFEKMLYDNAQLLRTYARAYKRTGSDRYLDVTRATAGWMLREMRDPAGGFWSSLDADSEGEEGRFYLWDLDEVSDATGDDFESARRGFGFTKEGNFEARNIPVWTGDVPDPAALERARDALMQRRDARIRPATDTKVLSGWNGLVAAALAEAGSHLDDSWVSAAAETMSFVLGAMRADGRLMRSYRDGTVKHLGFAEDYAFVLEACLALLEATAEEHWLDEARWAADEAIRLFHDDDRGGFFTTGADAERLIARTKDVMDNALPAANSVLALELQRLTMITGDERYASVAEGVLRSLAALMARSPLAFGHALGAVDLFTSEALEIVIVGPRQDRSTEELLQEVHSRFLPNKVIVSGEAGSDLSPLLEGRTMIDGSPTAYVCRSRTCKQPVTRVEDLADQLAG